MNKQFFIEITRKVNASWVRWESETGCFSLSKGTTFPIVGFWESWIICQVEPKGLFKGNRFWLNRFRHENKIKIVKANHQ